MENRSESWSDFRRLLPAVGLLLGAAGGYLYYRLAGCASGTCPISSAASALYGAAPGAPAGYAFIPVGKKREGSGRDA